MLVLAQPLRRARRRGTGVKSIGPSVMPTRPVTAGSGQAESGGNCWDIVPPVKRRHLIYMIEGAVGQGILVDLSWIASELPLAIASAGARANPGHISQKRKRLPFAFERLEPAFPILTWAAALCLKTAACPE